MAAFLDFLSASAFSAVEMDNFADFIIASDFYSLDNFILVIFDCRSETYEIRPKILSLTGISSG